ncbi:hypothetical protein [Microcoleus anatoxicus]|uniref:Uncharacterized protein n=1 Tax=Microcoleus anatoxicus PTRS2 TaxID=2705321 RepID=A0ABU8YW40_9CYAN
MNDLTAESAESAEEEKRENCLDLAKSATTGELPVTMAIALNNSCRDDAPVPARLYLN